jgi:hypothetical protein
MQEPAKDSAKENGKNEEEFGSLQLSEGNSTNQNPAGTFQTLDAKLKFQDSFDLSSFNLEMLTSEERQEEIARCEKIHKHYSRMMYLISSNSGWNSFSDRNNFTFLAKTLRVDPAIYTDFQADIGSCWSAKPLYGWLSDSFYPFTYRIKPYVVFMSILNSVTCLYVLLGGAILYGDPQPTYRMFWWANMIINVTIAFIDALAEGISAINTKLQEKIKILKEAEKRQTGNVLEEEEENEMKSFGNFNLIRGLLRAIMSVMGGILSSKLSINVAYLILGTYPIILALYTMVIFRESSKRRWVTSLTFIIQGLRALGKTLIRPFILLPAIYMYLNMTFPPAPAMYDYILTKKGGMSVTALSVIDNTASIIYYFVLLVVINKVKNVPLWKMFIIAGFANNLSYMMLFSYFFTETLSHFQIGCFRFIWSLINFLAVDLLLMPIIGRISKFLPEGFESTGVVVVISGLNLCGVFQGKMGVAQLDKWGIMDGYYERALPVYFINFAIQMGIYMSAPLFLFKG